MQQEFESWDLTLRVLSPRSRLYAPAPEGIGTALVESLSSYAARLADAHAVSTADLVRRELSRHTSPPLIFYSHDMNGLGRSAARWVETLERVTCRSDLRYLTFLPFKHLFSNQLFLRRTRAWCPECCREMAVRGTVYEPLLWCLKLVEACSRHRRVLATACSQCGQSLRPLYAGSRTGRCFWCGTELGFVTPATIKKTQDPAPTQFQLWVADAVGELLSHASEVRPEGLASRVPVVLAAYTRKFAGGNCAAAAEAALCPVGVFYEWLYGRSRPQIGNLFRAWYHLKLPVSLLFCPDSELLLRENAGQTKIKIHRRREVRPRYSREPVRRAIHAALDELPSPTLTEIARRLGFATADPLRRADPAACAHIVTNYHHSGQSNWWSRRGAKPICELSRAKKVLENHLRAEDRIPCLNGIAMSLGYASAAFLRRKFPELWRALAARISRHRKARRRIIEMAFERALHEDPPPAIRDVYRRIGVSAVYTRNVDERALCQRLKARRWKHAEARHLELLNQLKSTLKEAPPPAPKQVYKRLGITESIAFHNFPDLRRAIIVRHRKHRHQQSCARQEAVREEIRRIVLRLHKQGVCPSVNRVRGLVKDRSLLKWRAFYEAVRHARRALVMNRS